MASKPKSYWAIKRMIRKNVRETMSACTAASARPTEEKRYEKRPKIEESVPSPVVSIETDDIDSDDSDQHKGCQPSSSHSASEFQDNESDIDQNDASEISHEANRIEDREWINVLNELEKDTFLAEKDEGSDSSDDTDSELEMGQEESESEEKKSENLAIELGLWASSFGISFVAMAALLTVLRIYFPLLPKDPRTLLKTPRFNHVKTVEGGSYVHFGIVKCVAQSKDVLQYLLSRLQSCFQHITVLSLQINMDGLPLFKSASTQLWPILARVCNPFKSAPFMIGLFCGDRKPANVEEYLHDFVEEMQHLEQGPVDINVEENKVPVRINISCFVCDAPARAYVKQIKGHCGYYGCEKCVQKGSWEGKVTFPEKDAELRTDISFDEMRNAQHHNSNSPLRALAVGLVTQFPLEYMHLVCLGVMRRILMYWLKSPVSKGVRLSQAAIKQISDNLIQFQKCIPREFVRKCRGLREIERWKATEFRQFLLYSGIVALKGCLSQVIYDNFLLIFVAMRCLANPELCETHADYAHRLLCKFLDEAGNIYGADFFVYNVHGLVHIANDVISI